MTIDKAYKFKVSLSLESFIDKTICNAMLGKAKDKEQEKEFKAIRKQYGFTRNVSYKETEITAAELCDKLIHGYVFCQCFNPKLIWKQNENGKMVPHEPFNKDGGFPTEQKTNEHFKEAYLMCIDIDDEFEIKTIKDYVSRLRFKPTFYYTTYNHNQPGKGLRFRIVYVLDKPITGNYLYYRYCNYKLNCLVEEDTKSIIHDTCNLTAAQYFNGTYVDNPKFDVEYEISDIIYSLSDFGIYSDTSLDYAEFLKNRAAYSGSAYYSNKVEIESELFRIKPEQKIIKVQQEEDEKDIFSDSFVIKEILKEQDIPTYFIKDMKQLSYEDFRNKYHLQFIYRKISEEWFDLIIEDTNYKWQNIPENYFELPYYTTKIKNGDKRRWTIEDRLCLRKIIKPWITPKEMLYNAYLDLHKFIDNTDKSDLITVEHLIKKVNLVMNRPLEDILNDSKIKDNIDYCLTQTPKYEYGVLFGPGINYKTGLHYWLIKRFDELYDPGKSIDDNLEYINQVFISENRKPISKRLLYDYKKGIEPNKRLTGKELKSKIDFSKGIWWNLNQLRSIGYKVNQQEVTKLINQRKKQREQRKKKETKEKINLEQ